jgi:hypothetical protein
MAHFQNGTVLFNAYDKVIDSAMIDRVDKNGNVVTEQVTDPQWPTCLACVVTLKESQNVPGECQACLQKNCVTCRGGPFLVYWYNKRVH